ncbi:hypothetical protein GCM10023339_29600 [Alloalcanivorax gelatiniphagus]
MTAERLNPPRWRRRRTDAPEDTLLVRETEETRSLVVEPVPLHRAMTSRSPVSGGSSVVRASDHRRAQVRSRGPEAVLDGPTGPVASTRSTEPTQEPTVEQPVEQPVEPAVDPVRARVEQAWTLVVQVLGHEVGTLSSALLCTTDGQALATHGLADPDVPDVARVTSTVFASARELTAARHGAQEGVVETVQLSSGGSHTVVASVPVAGHDPLVLSVTADSDSFGVMLVQTRQAADGLRELLSTLE